MTIYFASPPGTPITDRVLAAARTCAGPTYLYDLVALEEHLRTIRDRLPNRVELFYAVKANPASRLLRVIARHVTGMEISSGGELNHVRRSLPLTTITAFSGPGKTDAELDDAIAAGVSSFHVESSTELRRLSAMAHARASVAEVLLRVNVPVTGVGQGALVMGGRSSPFGMDTDEAEACLALLPDLRGIRVRGIHAHLASGLDAGDCAAVARQVVAWTVRFGARTGLTIQEVNVGGGMAVDYRRPGRTFDWDAYGAALARLAEEHSRLTIQVEPGRAVTAYCGWYATPVLDVKISRGKAYAVVAGGTHHMRTPAAKGHDQPLVVVPTSAWLRPWPRPSGAGPVTVVGQLCTPRDVLGSGPELAAGDIVVFALVGAYAWNISHHDFLMYKHPAIRYLG